MYARRRSASNVGRGEGALGRGEGALERGVGGERSPEAIVAVVVVMSEAEVVTSKETTISPGQIVRTGWSSCATACMGA